MERAKDRGVETLQMVVRRPFNRHFLHVQSFRFRVMGILELIAMLCDGVGVARLLNAILVLPKFKVAVYWNESREINFLKNEGISSLNSILKFTPLPNPTAHTLPNISSITPAYRKEDNHILHEVQVLKGHLAKANMVKSMVARPWGFMNMEEGEEKNITSTNQITTGGNTDQTTKTNQVLGKESLTHCKIPAPGKEKQVQSFTDKVYRPKIKREGPVVLLGAGKRGDIPILTIPRVEISAGISAYQFSHI
ncbi:hypothetical protein GIB67_035678 [Kingdonia uniflora]|uniref:Uncharacterized protein n=1 Tax=Kingdonia uniflora TaxID=39325 RepID=A0A7J7MII9_9MAGN|nr:hypothetical protein GIB67_035678 [Kingdonia uniflora]